LEERSKFGSNLPGGLVPAKFARAVAAKPAAHATAQKIKFQASL
jgi:hypothetical protein